MSLPINSILLGDCRKLVSNFPDNSIDLVFIDPPYNLQLKSDLFRPDGSKVSPIDDEWDKFNSFCDYDKFTKEYLSIIKPKMKDTATIWVMGMYQGIFRVGSIMQDLGFWILNDILYIKDNPTPQMSGRRFCNSQEHLIWASKSEKSKKYTFNYKLIKAANEDKQLRSDWYMPYCSKKEKILDEEGNKVHNTQKPENLLKRIIIATSNREDIILDPMCGTGTTCAVAKKLGRQYIGIDVDKKNVETTIKRLEEIGEYQLINDDSILIENKKKKIPFLNLVENETIKVNSILKLYNSPTKVTKHIATVNDDGTISSSGIKGSIHQVGKKLLDLPSCNGWMHWYYLDNSDNKEKPIDNLRSNL